MHRSYRELAILCCQLFTKTDDQEALPCRWRLHFPSYGF